MDSSTSKVQIHLSDEDDDILIRSHNDLRGHARNHYASYRDFPQEDRDVRSGPVSVSEDMLKRAMHRKMNVRLSPMASALIQKKSGVYLPPTHIATPVKPARVLSPACTTALREHSRQHVQVQVQVPENTMANQFRDIINSITEGNSKNSNPPDIVSSMQRSAVALRVPVSSPRGTVKTASPRSPKMPFFPALHESLAGISLKDNDYRNDMSRVLQDVAPKFIPRAPRSRVRKRAVIICVTYKNNRTQRESPMFGQSARTWFNLLVRNLEFLTDEIRLLCDAPLNCTGNATVLQPTNQNIKSSLLWLTSDVGTGDRLFLAYCGDVAFEKSFDKDPKNPARHAIVPSDYPQKTGIWDSEILSLMKKLPADANMTIFLDCRMSWNLVRLPYIYFPHKFKKKGAFELYKAFTADSGIAPIAGPIFDQMVLSKGPRSHSGSVHVQIDDKEKVELDQQRLYFESFVKEFESMANIVCFAATPAKYMRFRRFKSSGVNWISKGDYTNAVEIAVSELTKAGRLPSYRQIMFHMAHILSPPGVIFQVPQVCSARELDLDKEMRL